jgi:glycerophosphoryl diester phosphodiesterase
MSVTPPPPAQPIVIAHRGASAERPEHTLEAYDLAIAQGADFIEPDLVMTKDGILVARHENEIAETTDVASRSEFAGRRTTRTIDGHAVTGWFTEDFTLAELRTLRARERLPQLRPANTAYDGHFLVPTLAEVIALAQRRSRETSRTIGIYPELKHPTYFRAIGLPMEQALVAELARSGLTRHSSPVFIQSFEVGVLETLNRLTEVRLVQLLSDDGAPFDRPDRPYRTMATPEGLAAIARYADGVGPAKALILPRGADGPHGQPDTLRRRRPCRRPPRPPLDLPAREPLPPHRAPPRRRPARARRPGGGATPVPRPWCRRSFHRCASNWSSDPPKRTRQLTPSHKTAVCAPASSTIYLRTTRGELIDIAQGHSFLAHPARSVRRSGSCRAAACTGS